MKKHNTHKLLFGACIFSVAVFASGCIVRTYSVVKDRVDQQVTGNQGYLTGSNPAGTQAPKKFTQRTTKVVEIELRSPVKVERLKEPPIENRQTSDTSLEGNLGFVEGGPEAFKPIPMGQSTASITPAEKFDTYKVQKGDTLQKISSQPEIYGTSKKWMKIYEANKDKLKSPDKIRPGQELKIPRD